MDRLENQEIVPLNRELYSNLSIDELEERLELDCWVYFCLGINCDTQGCNVDVDVCVANGIGGGCNEAVQPQ